MKNEDIEKIFNEYELSKKTEDIQNEILQKVREYPNRMWGVHFSYNREMYNKIEKIENELLAKDSLENVRKFVQDYGSRASMLYLEGTVALCLSKVKSQETGKIKQEILEVWNNIFQKEYPNFKNNVLNSQLKHDKAEKEYLEKINIEKKKNKP